MNPYKKFLAGKAGLIYLISNEEARVERIIASCLGKSPTNRVKLYGWSCLGGFTNSNGAADLDTDPVACLSHFLKLEEQAFLVFKDLHLLIQENPRLIRQLKECARVLRKSKKKIFFVSPRFVLPTNCIPFSRLKMFLCPRTMNCARFCSLA